MLFSVALGCAIVGVAVVVGGVDGVDGFVDGTGGGVDVVRPVELVEGRVGVGGLVPGAWVPFVVVVPGVRMLVVDVVPSFVVLRIVVGVNVGPLVEVGRTLHEQIVVAMGLVLKGGSVGLPAVSRSEIHVPLVFGNGPVGGGRT